MKKLDVAASERAIAAHVAKPLGIEPFAAAEAIVRVANARMADAIRLVSVERGHDPQKFMLMPFGGGGGLHAGALVADCGLKGAIVPRFPGVTSALGCVIADIRHDSVETVNLMLGGLDAAALGNRMRASADAARAVVEDAGLEMLRVDVIHELDMHYVGQTHTVPVPIAAGTPVTEATIRTAFEASYQRAFSRLLGDLPMKILSLRTAAIGRRPPFDLSALAPDKSASLDKARRGSRKVWFSGKWHETALWSRLDLPVDAKVGGPAILEQGDATTVVEPGQTARVDQNGNIIIEPAA